MVKEKISRKFHGNFLKRGFFFHGRLHWHFTILVKNVFFLVKRGAMKIFFTTFHQTFFHDVRTCCEHAVKIVKKSQENNTVVKIENDTFDEIAVKKCKTP